MPNPYLDDFVAPSPGPAPKPNPSGLDWLASQSWLPLATLALAVAGVFLPPEGGWKWETLPIPPFVDPTPNVDPAKTEGSWVIVVEETSMRTPEIAKVLGNTTYWVGLEDRGLNWRMYDADASDAAPYTPLADSVGMPAVLIVGGKGEIQGDVLGKFKLPADTDTLDAKIKESTGR